ncbi:MAG: hypothetical protein HXX18_06960 [Bacteroidetes bacterium]|nr:hypothetical protein [Bacteroidota bacterium]
MKYLITKIFIFFIGIMCFSFVYSKCKTRDNDDNKIYKQIKNIRKFEYKIFNPIKDSLGYKTFTDDADVGISSIVISPNSDFIFIADAFHNNIKKIDAKNGVIVKVSDDLDKLNISVNDLAIFNNRIYLTCYFRYVIIMDLDLKFIDRLDFTNSHKDVWSLNDTNLIVKLDEEGNKINFLQINESNKPQTLLKIIPPKELIRRETQTFIHGKKYVVINENNNYYLETEKYGMFKLKTPIPSIKSYNANNFDFNEKSIAYFEPLKEKYCIYLIDY